MTSRPLFISVAESMVILPPIDQVGWRSASSTVTSSSSARVRPRNGPPEAVSTSSRRSCRARSPASSWCSAECSESTGRICAPVASASCMTSSPPTTSDSLLASARSIPSPSVATVGPRPALPTQRVEHQVGLGLEHQPDQALCARRAPRRRSTPPPRARRRRRRRARCGDAVAARPARPAAPRSARPTGRRARDRRVRADHVERLGADRAGRAEHEETAGHVPQRVAARTSMLAQESRTVPGSSFAAARRLTAGMTCSP